MNTYERIVRKIASINDPNLNEACYEIMENDKFFHWPASLSYHHAYAGGLAEHTLEVFDIAEYLCDSPHIQKANKDIIGASCLFHDFLKTEEYILSDSTIEGQRYLNICSGKYVGYLVKREGKDVEHAHIVNGAKFFMELAKKYNIDSRLAKPIEHCLLAHHGYVKEWGSPIAPQTLEAMIVHQADMLSAKAGRSK